MQTQLDDYARRLAALRAALERNRQPTHLERKTGLPLSVLLALWRERDKGQAVQMRMFDE
jgi:hypothetical protein